MTSGIELWLLDAERSADALIACERRDPRLPADEIAQKQGPHGAPVAPAWLARRIALRVLVERFAGPGPARAPLVQTAAGKPALAGGAPHFSLGHSGRFVLLGVSPAAPLGVDIEQPRDMRLAERRRTAIEAAAIMLNPRQDLGRGQTRSLQAWTRLEAAAKADGCGIGRLLTTFGLIGRKGGVAARSDLAQAVREWLAASRLSVSDLRLRAGLVAAVATQAHVERWTVLDFPASERGIAELLSRPASESDQAAAQDDSGP